MTNKCSLHEVIQVVFNTTELNHAVSAMLHIEQLTLVHPWRCPSCEIHFHHASPHLSDYWNNICFSQDRYTYTAWKLKHLQRAWCKFRIPNQRLHWSWNSTYDRSLPLCLSNSRFPRESKPSLRPMPRPLPPPRPPLPPPRPLIGLSPMGLKRGTESFVKSPSKHESLCLSEA